MWKCWGQTVGVWEGVSHYHWGGVWKGCLVPSPVGVCGVTFQSLVRFETDCQKFFGIGSVQNLTNSAEWFAGGSESKFICVIRVTKHCEACVLQTASIVEPSPAFLVSFHEPTFFVIPNFSDIRLSEFQKWFGTSRFGFWNSDSEPNFGILQTPAPQKNSRFWNGIF